MLIELEKDLFGGEASVSVDEYYAWDPVTETGAWSETSWDLAPEAAKGLGGITE